jgi:photoactive yellow protein
MESPEVMMSMRFDQPDLVVALDAATDAVLDALAFGVIGFGPDGLVTRYNTAEAQGAGFSAERVIGRHLFLDVAPCMNNYLVAQRFEDETALDALLDYTFTFRVRPTPVRLRLLQDPAQVTRYVVVLRPAVA